MSEETKDSNAKMDRFAEIYTEVTKLMGKGEIEFMTPNRLTELVSEAVGIDPVPNMAVERCTRLFTMATVECLAKGKSPEFIRKGANLAYCLAMPSLTGPDSISDFIACVTHGMLLGAIPSADATRLLYAAQVAHSAIPKNRKSLMKMMEKSAKKKLTTAAESTASTDKI